MNCPFCAEEIQEAARLCRFCGATRGEGQSETGWDAPAPKPLKVERPAGWFTIRTTAVLFVLSGVFQLFGLTEKVPLLGEVRGGVVVVLYHLVYAGLFTAIGIGVWARRRWGYRLLMATTALYTLDRALYMADQTTLRRYLDTQLEQSERLLGPGAGDLVLTMLTAITGLFVLSWWGFALYVRWRRAYFDDGA